MKHFRLILMVIMVIFIGAQWAGAVKLKAIQTLTLREAAITYNDKSGGVSGIAKVQNPTNNKMQFRVFVSFTSTKDGKELLRVPASKRMEEIGPMSQKTVSFTVDNLQLPKGNYDAIVLLDSGGLGVSSLRKVGTLNIKKSNISPFNLHLDCSSRNESVELGIVPIVCRVEPAISADDNYVLEYTIKPVGSETVYVKNNIKLANVNGNRLEFNLPALNVPGGTVDVVLQLNGGNQKSNMSFTRFFMRGEYTKIISLKKIPSQKQIEIYLNGSLNSDGRRMLVGLIDFDKVCFSKDLDLKNLAPLIRNVSYKNVSGCAPSGKAFAIVYKQRAANTPYEADDILAVSGLADRASAISVLNSVFKEPTLFENLFKDSTYVVYIILSLIILLVMLIVIFALKKIGNKAGVIGVLFALILLPASFSHAEVFDSLDAPKARFEVSFPDITKEVGQNDNIVFSFAAVDNFSGGVNKYPGAEVYVWIDNASSTKTKIMDAADSSPIVAVSLPHDLSLGVHTLNFEVPASTGICGAAYDFSNFDESVFDPLPCEFSVDFTIVPGSKIALTFYASPKAVPLGSSSKLYWFSAGANSCTASDGWSGSKALNNTAGEPTNAINSAFQDFTLTCSNSTESISRTDTVYTYVCGDNFCSQWEDCNLCEEDCGACDSGQTLSITADPQLVREGGVSYITWHSNGFINCSVSEDNPAINDAWDRLAGVEKTSPLDRDTVYTLSCSGGGGNQTRSVKVRMVPDFIEF